jgi:hypothetical protein
MTGEDNVVGLQAARAARAAQVASDLADLVFVGITEAAVITGEAWRVQAGALARTIVMGAQIARAIGPPLADPASEPSVGDPDSELHELEEQVAWARQEAAAAVELLRTATVRLQVALAAVSNRP